MSVPLKLTTIVMNNAREMNGNVFLNNFWQYQNRKTVL